MLETLVNMLSSGAVESHTPQTAVAAVLCGAGGGCLASELSMKSQVAASPGPAYKKRKM